MQASTVDGTRKQMNRLSLDCRTQIVSALVEGNSIRGTERMTGVHRDTIMRLQRAQGGRH